MLIVEIRVFVQVNGVCVCEWVCECECVCVCVQVHFICIAHLQQPPGWPKCFTEEQDYTTYTENRPDKKM